MTVRIGTGSASVDPSELRVAGVAPSRIMLGTGTGAVEVWPGRYVANSTGGKVTIPASTWAVVHSVTVSSPGGRGVITAKGVWDWFYTSRQYGLRISVNGNMVASEMTPSTGGADGTTSISAPERLLISGDSVEMLAYSSSSYSNGLRIIPTILIM